MLLNNTASRFLLYYLLFIKKSNIVTIQIQRVLPTSRSTTTIYATSDVGPAEYLLSVITNIRLKQQDEWRQFMLASYYVNSLCPTLYNRRFFAASPVYSSLAFLRSSSSSLSISLRPSCLVCGSFLFSTGALSAAFIFARSSSTDPASRRANSFERVSPLAR